MKHVRECPPCILLLTKGAVTRLDYEDWLEQRKFNWHLTCQGYAARNVKIGHRNFKPTFLHRILLSVPEGMEADHIDGDRLNNNRSNLRVCSRGQNMFNKKIYHNNKLGLKGVHAHYGKFRAVIQLSGKRINLGSFEDPLEASVAYQKAASELFGDFVKQH